MDNDLKWQADRTNIYRLKFDHPDYSLSQLAQALYRSEGRVKKMAQAL